MSAPTYWYIPVPEPVPEINDEPAGMSLTHQLNERSNAAFAGTAIASVRNAATTSDWTRFEKSGITFSSG